LTCILISRLSYTSGRTIALEAARSLGYEVVDQEIFQEASNTSGVSESKLLKAFQDPPTLFGMSSSTRKRYVVHVSAALAKRFLKGNVIYQGPFGYPLITGVSHVLKVRIFAQREDRVAAMVDRERGLSAAEAEKAILKQDRARAALAKQVFQTEDDDTNLFDLVINTSQVDASSAVEIITNTAKLKRYQPMTYSIRCMENLELCLRVRAHITDVDVDAEVEADGGRIRIRTHGGGGLKKRKLSEIEQRVAALEGVEAVEVEMVEDKLGRVAGGS
jgi:cytidylate kinase